MNCLICNSVSEHYFSKDHSDYPGSPYKISLKVDYCKCKECGFVFSRTHQELDRGEWLELNSSWHHAFEKNGTTRKNNQPPYPEQALVLMILNKNKIINLKDTLDYAAGYGTMANILFKYFGEEIKIYDEYVFDHNSEIQYIHKNSIKKYSLVVNSAMFEHILKRQDLDCINNLVENDGVLMLHTLVCENIPCDPNWFYLEPLVHTAFHTNKSMEILMKQWGYAASIYSPQAKSWFLFKKDFPGIDRLENFVQMINIELQANYFYYKNGFMDYWKGY